MSTDPLDPEEIAFAGVLGQLDLLRRGAVTAADLLELSLARIARLDGRLHAFRTVFAGAARDAARAADDRRSRGEDQPLLGIPVAVKDSDPVRGHAGALGTGSTLPTPIEDCERVGRLRAAGAVVVGTTHLPELALWPFTASATWGVTRNPWDPSRTPGGSSGGSAAAVAAGMVAAATASDGGGSIRVPAACCHLVGLKPTRDLVPLAPDRDHWEGLSCAGVLTRDVADQAYVLGVLAGRALEAAPVTGPLRIAWSVRAAVPTRVDPEVRAALDRTSDLLRDLGHDVVAGDPDLARVQAAFLVRYAAGVEADLGRLADPTRTELRTRAVAAVGRRLPQGARDRAQGWSVRAAARLAALPAGADVLLTPVLPFPPGPAGAGRPGAAGLTTLATAGQVVPYTIAWNVTGQPALSLPVGRTRGGLPLAVQLVGAPGRDDLLLGLAAQLEAALAVSGDRPPGTAGGPA